MPVISFNITNALLTELTEIAGSEGFPNNPKAWAIYWLQQKIKASRVNKAKADAEVTAGAQADIDTGGIT